MPETLRGLTADQESRLAAMLQWFESRRPGLDSLLAAGVARSAPQQFAIPVQIGKAAANITAGSQGNVTPWQLSRDDDDVLSEAATDDDDIEIHDWLEAGIGSGDRVVMLRHPRSGELIALTPISLRIGKTDASHSKGASGTISLYSGTGGSASDTTENVTAYNRFADLDSGKWCLLAYIGGGWELVAGEC